MASVRSGREDTEWRRIVEQVTNQGSCGRLEGFKVEVERASRSSDLLETLIHIERMGEGGERGGERERTADRGQRMGASCHRLRSITPAHAVGSAVDPRCRCPVESKRHQVCPTVMTSIH